MTEAQTTEPNIYTQKTALVIGATGGVGGAAMRALQRRGWRIKALNRNPKAAAKAHPTPGVTWIKGDAMVPADVLAAAEGAALIVHGANPPGYRNWGKLVLPMLDSTIAAAKAHRARILFPGTVYNYGPDVYEPDGASGVTETAPQNPRTRKGKIRAEMERRLQASGVPTIIVRAGDFFGPGATANSWFLQIVKPGRSVRSISNPAAKDAGHAWAYLPDLGETMARLAERADELPIFATFHFGGHWFESGQALGQAIRRVAERPKAPIRTFPWFIVVGLSPVVPLFRELAEMRYLWKRPLRLDNSKLTAFLGEEPHTPTDCAVAGALDALGCLQADWPVTSQSIVTA